MMNKSIASYTVGSIRQIAPYSYLLRRIYQKNLEKSRLFNKKRLPWHKKRGQMVDIRLTVQFVEGNPSQ
jgi:hypothetical protein